MKISTRQLAKAGLLIAISVIFTRLFSFRLTPVLRIGFGQLPIILAGITLNPLLGFTVGVLADLSGFMINSMGGMFIPGLTLSAGLCGLIPGLVYQRLKKKPKVAVWLSVSINALVVNALINTYWLSLYIGSFSFMAALPMRVINHLIMIPINSILAITLLKTPVFKDIKINK
ncbi:folate family ECF transporter S component [Clostridium sp. 'deep sea']|uniref:folate family ECF transporter S component n=1 Tax=Clostridium sp. 'deep sea' TaxID=2779445 RepID=UPI0018967EC1|nr:folate family ECF transporter S component [Clostridium sp. 'deep sea']QOR36479.1 folate family ECF transporter S component [Clostridium sp. 'deep sea']